MAQEPKVTPDPPLFGEPRQRTRFDPGTRAGQREWEPLEELLLWPVVACCESETADFEARRWLCTVLGRNAVRAGDNRTEAELAQAERLIVANRIVTRHIADAGPNRAAIVAARDACFTGGRTGAPVTWGEYNSVWRPWEANVNGQKRILASQVLRYLDRAASDLKLFRAAPPPDRGSARTAGRPARSTNRKQLGAAVRMFLEAPVDDGAQLRIFWQTLWIAAST